MTFSDETPRLVGNHDDMESESESSDSEMESRHSSLSIASRSRGAASQIPSRRSLRSEIPQAPLKSSLIRAKGARRHSNLPSMPGVAHFNFAQPTSPNATLSKDRFDSSFNPGISFLEADNALESVVLSQPPSIYLEAPIWPLTDPSEALLLRHYVQNLATWVYSSPHSL